MNTVKFFKANTSLLAFISFIFFVMPSLHSEDDVVSYLVKIELDNSVVLQGYVYKDRVYEKNGAKGFVKSQKKEEGSGIRLWYVKGTKEWKFVSSSQIKNVITIKDIKAKDFDLIKEKWSKEAKKIAKKLQSNKEKAATRKVEEEKKRAEKKEAKERAKAEKKKNEKNADKNNKEEEALLKKALKELEGLTPDKMKEEQILLYFRGFKEEDRKRLVAKRNAVGGPAALTQIEKDFLTHYALWEKAIKNAAKAKESENKSNKKKRK